MGMWASFRYIACFCPSITMDGLMVAWFISASSTLASTSIAYIPEGLAWTFLGVLLLSNISQPENKNADKASGIVRSSLDFIGKRF